MHLPHLAAKLAAETGISTKTTRKWLDGGGVAPGIAYALRAAAKKLGIERPQPQQPVSEAG